MKRRTAIVSQQRKTSQVFTPGMSLDDGVTTKYWGRGDLRLIGMPFGGRVMTAEQKLEISTSLKASDLG